MWFLIWLAFFVFLILLPLGYGWGYRGWGAPYPSVWARRRASATTYEAASGWGIAADVLWLLALVAIVWFTVAVLTV